MSSLFQSRNRIVESHRLHSKFPCQFGNRIRSCRYIHPIVASFVIRLFKTSSPTTIFLAIISINIFPIYLGIVLTELFYMICIGSVHIVPKLLKRIPETFNTATTIIQKTLLIWIRATSFYGKKHLVETSPAHPVSSIGLANCLFLYFCAVHISNIAYESTKYRKTVYSWHWRFRTQGIMTI